MICLFQFVKIRICCFSVICNFKLDILGSVKFFSYCLLTFYRPNHLLKNILTHYYKMKIIVTQYICCRALNVTSINNTNFYDYYFL